MAGHIPENVLDEIQSRCDIVEIISQYIPLRRTGNNFKTTCPFHNERTPSFIVSPTKQIYHCFGCGVGGNVFNFVMQHEHLDFVDAVRLLASKAGIVIPEKDFNGEKSVLKDLWTVNEFACELFHKWLLNPTTGKIAYNYLKSRAIREDIIKKFLLGYAPSGSELMKEAAKKGFSNDLLARAGLVAKSGGKYVDMFRNRLMIPILNPVGKVIGFSGRVLDDALPKYLNTPETSLFHKGKVLYGLNFTKSEIIKEDKVIIFEGYFDFIRAYQEGLHNIAASQGTAFTIDHVHLLKRYASTIIVSFDGDSAGEKASLSGLDMFLSEGIHVKIVELTKGHDPDTFIKTNGIEKFRELIKNAKDILDAKLERLCEQYPINTTDGKLKVIASILPDIANIKNEIYKRHFINRVSCKLNIPEESIWLELKRIKKSINNKSEQNSKFSATTENIFAKSVDCPGERHLVQALMDYENLPADILDDFIVSQMKHDGYKKILELIINLHKTNKWRGPSSLMQQIKDETLLALISQLATEEIPGGLDKDRIIRDCICDIKRRYRDNRIKSLLLELEEAEKNKHDISALMQEIVNLRKGVICITQDHKGGSVK